MGFGATDRDSAGPKADGIADGVIGKNTHAAIRKAEEHYHLAVDGKVSDALLNKLVNDPEVAQAIAKARASGTSAATEVADGAPEGPKAGAGAVQKPDVAAQGK